MKPIELTDPERQQLESWARRHTSAQRLALRSRTLLAAAEPISNTAVAARLGITPPTVRKWRQRFLAHRLDGLADEPRPGAPRAVTDGQAEEAVIRTPETTPANATHWGTRLLANEAGLSQNAAVRTWRAFGLKPHPHETFKLSAGPLFIDKARGVVGLYLSPPDRAIVLGIDEKGQVQAPGRTRPVIPPRPGQPRRRTHGYVRHGTTSPFGALGVATGRVIGQCHRQQRHQEFVQFLDRVDEAPVREEGVTAHVVMDNYGTHKHPAVKRWFTGHPEYRCHFTPTSASWLNQVERFFAQITNKRIRRGPFHSAAELEAAIQEYLKRHNEDPKPDHWR